MQGSWEVPETGQNLVFATYPGGKGSQNEPHIIYVNTGHISHLNYIGMDIYTHTDFGNSMFHASLKNKIKGEADHKWLLPLATENP